MSINFGGFRSNILGPAGRAAPLRSAGASYEAHCNTCLYVGSLLPNITKFSSPGLSRRSSSEEFLLLVGILYNNSDINQ